MAHYDKESRTIILSEEDKENFNGLKANFTPSGIKTPIADSIIKKLVTIKN